MRPLVLVTGASGSIGRAVVPSLGGVAAVVPTSRSTTAPPRDLAVPGVAEVVLAETRPAVVLHLAGGRAATLADMRRNNVESTRYLVTAASRIEPAPVVAVMGSAAEYGESPDRIPFAEDASLRPRSAYGEVKREQSELALELGSNLGVAVSVLRLFNVVSATPPIGVAVAHWRRQLLAAAPGTVADVECGDLDLVRDFVPARLLAEALAAFVARQPDQRVINLCTGAGRTGGELLEAMARRWGVVAHPRRNTAYDDPAASRFAVGDPTVMQRTLGPLAVPDLDALAKEALGV